jgi:hypothetical protein
MKYLTLFFYIIWRGAPRTSIVDVSLKSIVSSCGVIERVTLEPFTPKQIVLHEL